MVRISPLASMTTPLPSRSAPRVSAVRAPGIALMLSLTIASNGSTSPAVPGIGALTARQVDNAAVKNEGVT